jgi:hypothetical protein
LGALPISKTTKTTKKTRPLISGAGVQQSRLTPPDRLFEGPAEKQKTSGVSEQAVSDPLNFISRICDHFKANSTVVAAGYCPKFVHQMVDKWTV